MKLEQRLKASATVVAAPSLVPDTVVKSVMRILNATGSKVEQTESNVTTIFVKVDPSSEEHFFDLDGADLKFLGGLLTKNKCVLQMHPQSAKLMKVEILYNG